MMHYCDSFLSQITFARDQGPKNIILALKHKSDGFNSISSQMIFFSSVGDRVVVEEIESDNIVGSILFFYVEP